MLTGVLLHVVEPALPVDDTMDLVADSQSCNTGARQHVNDVVTILVVVYIDHAGAAEQTDIEGLAARGGIKAAPVQGDQRAIGLTLHVQDRGIELQEIRIGVIEAFGHDLAASSGSTTPASANPLARSTQLSHRPHGEAPAGS